MAVVAGSLSSAEPGRAGNPPARWKLTWADEFDGDRIDPAKWDFDLGNGFVDPRSNRFVPGWGNGELQYYTSDTTNAFVRDGLLHVRALKQPSNGFDYSSARLKTRKRDGAALFNQKYGRFEFRAKLPTGRGLWSALWMLPQDDKYGPWPASGEIDVVEARGQEPGKVHGTLHYGGRGPAHEQSGRDFAFPDGGTVADFHVYALEWEPGEIRWLVDGRPYATQSSWWSSSKGARRGARPADADRNPFPAPFDQPFYLVINLAVGGNFVGRPDDGTAFPAEMLVDYVRVYENVPAPAGAKPRG